MPPRTPASEEWRASITARVTAVNDMLDEALEGLTLDQVNHVERAGVLPIAFSLLHVVGGQDRTVSRFFGGGADTIWDGADWAARIGFKGLHPGRGTPIADAEKVRIGDLAAWREYQSAVFAKTESALENAPLATFEKDAFGGERPPNVRGSFLQLLVPSGPIRVMDVCEAYIFQHASRHLGEIEHARALVGLGGLS
jgi:hypothetical protein